MKENKELTLIVNADKRSVSLKINAEVEKKSSKIELDPATLDFGTTESTLVFNVKNIGNSGKIDWNITGLDVDWIKIDPIKGTVEQEKSQAVKVTLARTMIKDHVKTTVLINTNGESLPLEIQAGEGLTPGSYNCTIFVRTDLGDTEIPVSMTVAQSTEIVVPQGLYTYYKFDGNFKDTSENAIDGFGVNSPTFVDGVGGGDSQAVKFSRNNNSSFVVPKPIIDSRKMTICFWGKDFTNGNIFYVPSSEQNQPMFTLSMSN